MSPPDPPGWPTPGPAFGGPAERTRALSGRVAVVTGASRGLGAGMAAHFAAAGMHLGLCARHRPELVAATRPRAHDGIVTPAVPPLAAAVDVTQFDEVAAFADAVVGRFGRIDLWVNNAALLATIGPLAEADPAETARLIEVNVTGVLFGSAVFASHVRTRPGPGVLVNISSGASVHPNPGWTAYCASKAAVDMATEVVAREERSHGLRAHSVGPGLVDTDMQAAIRATDPARFPDVHRFRKAKQDGAFNSARGWPRSCSSWPSAPTRWPRCASGSPRRSLRRPAGKVSPHGELRGPQVHQAGGRRRRGDRHHGQHLVVRPQAPAQAQGLTTPPAS